MISTPVLFCLFLMIVYDTAFFFYISNFIIGQMFIMVFKKTSPLHVIFCF